MPRHLTDDGLQRGFEAATLQTMLASGITGIIAGRITMSRLSQTLNRGDSHGRRLRLLYGLAEPRRGEADHSILVRELAKRSLASVRSISATSGEADVFRRIGEPPVGIDWKDWVADHARGFMLRFLTEPAGLNDEQFQQRFDEQPDRADSGDYFTGIDRVRLRMLGWIFDSRLEPAEHRELMRTRTNRFRRRARYIDDLLTRIGRQSVDPRASESLSLLVKALFDGLVVSDTVDEEARAQLFASAIVALVEHYSTATG